MATEVQTRSGRCATHGEVEARRELPRSDLGVLARWGAVGLAVALRRFVWTPVAATS
jgi:hypothetical protein